MRLLNIKNVGLLDGVALYRTSYLSGFYGLMNPLCTSGNTNEKDRWIYLPVCEETIELAFDKRQLLINCGNQFVIRPQMLYFDLLLKKVSIANSVKKNLSVWFRFDYAFFFVVHAI